MSGPVAVPTAPGTGIYMRVRRGERYENILLEEMSEEEIRDHFSPRQDAWKFIAALAKMAREAGAEDAAAESPDVDGRREYGIRADAEQAELVQILLALTPDQRGLAKAALWLIVSPSTTGLARGAIDGMMMSKVMEMGAKIGKRASGARGMGIGPSSAADRRAVARADAASHEIAGAIDSYKKTNGGEGGGG